MPQSINIINTMPMSVRNFITVRKKFDEICFHLCKIIWIYDISKGYRSIISVYLHAISFKLIAYDLLR